VTTAVSPDDPGLGVATDVRFEGDTLVVVLSNGREVTAPVADYRRLATATASQRANFRIEALGTSIHWPDVDEDIGVSYLLGVSEEELDRFAGFTVYSSRPQD